MVNVKKDKYSYPDVGDINESIYIENNEPYKGYWKKSEEKLFENLEDIFLKKRNKTILDIGAGDGRIIKRYQQKFEKITIIEPDKERIDKCKTTFKGQKKINFINSTFLNSNLRNQKFDIILCSQVLQFITTQNLEKFINKMHKHLKPKGRIIILTSHAKGDKDYYRKKYIAYTDIKTKEISKEKFNSLRTNDENVLAMHHFSIQNLKKIFAKFRTIDIRVFHLFHKKNFIDKIMFRDNFYNIPFLQKWHGEDVYLLLRKKRRNKKN